MEENVRRMALLLTLAAILVSACSPATSQPVSPLPTVASNVAPEELEEIAEGNTAFAFALYQVLSEAAPGEDNLFFSPYSISQALAMTYAGARTET